MIETTRVRERRERASAPREGRHRGNGVPGNFTTSFSALGALAYAGSTVSAKVTDLDSAATLVAIDDRIVLPTASVGEILLLIEVAARLTERESINFDILDRADDDTVATSGIWQHLQAPALPVADVAALVGATSDGLAANVLLSLVGLDAVRARAESIGLRHTALLDRVRDHRGPDEAPQLSIGSTAELDWLLAALARGEIVDQLTSSRVLGWLSLNVDFSMVANVFGLDPFAHRGLDHEVLLVNKTGRDFGVRCEVGVLRGPRAGVTYALTVQFDDVDLSTRLRVNEAMRVLGTDLLEYVH